MVLLTGCIDLANLDNSGIASAINTLRIVTDAFANNSTGLSRADVWSMAAIVAADVVNKGNHRKPIHFTFDWFGRVVRKHGCQPFDCCPHTSPSPLYDTIPRCPRIVKMQTKSALTPASRKFPALQLLVRIGTSPVQT